MQDFLDILFARPLTTLRDAAALAGLAMALAAALRAPLI